MKPNWWITRDGDPECLALFRRHYSHRPYRDGRSVKLFVGPGEKLVLRTPLADAMFVWRKFKDDSGQNGVCCAVFRNESGIRSSDLIREACDIAWAVWPDSRLYTFVDPRKVRSVNPGFCFQSAGWRRCPGRTSKGLIVMEREVPDGDR